MSTSKPDLQLIDRWEVIRMLGISESTLERMQVREEHFPYRVGWDPAPCDG